MAGFKMRYVFFILGLATLFFSLGSVYVAYGQNVDPYTGAACQQITYTCTSTPTQITDEFGCRASQNICQTTCGTTETNIFRLDQACIDQALRNKGCSVTTCTLTRICSASCSCTGTTEYTCSTTCGITYISNQGCIGAPSCSQPGQTQQCNPPTPTAIPPVVIPTVPPPAPTTRPPFGGGGNQANFGVGAGGGIPWYQTENGDVYAQNPVTVNISSTLPANVYLSLRQHAANPPYPGVITQGSDTRGTFGGGGPSNPGWYAMKSPYEGIRFDYAYFSSKFTANETMPASCTESVINAGDIQGGKTLCYTGAVTLSGPIAMPAGSASIVFVDGDLTIDKTISVTTGGFVVFIVKGTITVDSSLGQAVPSANPTIPDLQGMFIANEFISTNDPTVQTQLVIKGTVVGWNGIQLNRSLTDNTIPAEYFIFDPGLMRFAPASLMKSTILWQQVPA